VNFFIPDMGLQQHLEVNLCHDEVEEAYLKFQKYITSNISTTRILISGYAINITIFVKNCKMEL